MKMCEGCFDKFPPNQLFSGRCDNCVGLDADQAHRTKTERKQTEDAQPTAEEQVFWVFQNTWLGEFLSWITKNNNI